MMTSHPFVLPPHAASSRTRVPFSSTRARRPRPSARARFLLDTLESRLLLTTLQVLGNSVLINSANTPSLNDYTDFGYSAVNNPDFTLTRSYTLRSSDSNPINLLGTPIVTISGAAAGDFTVTPQLSNSSVNDATTTSLIITFTPTATGLRSATVTINNDILPFSFNIQGTAVNTLTAATGYGTQYTQLATGSGTGSVDGDNIVVNYTGYLRDGTKFDSSLNPGRTPFDFLLGANTSGQYEVIVGWEVGMRNLKIGEQRVLFIPSSEAYGASGSGNIPANANLIFTVERLPQLEILDSSGVYIYSDSTTPSTSNHTNFGLFAPGASAVTYTYYIIAPTPPYVTSMTSAGFVPQVTGTNASQFTATTVQYDNGGYTYFTVRFTPGTTTGVRSATISLPYKMITSSNVTTNMTYTFAVQGTISGLPVGAIDAITPTALSGWVADLDAPASAVTITVKVDGATTSFYTGAASLARPDLTALSNTNHGYSVNLSSLTPGTHTVALYAIDTSSGAATLIGTRTVTNRAPIGAIDSATLPTLSGWVGDLDARTTSLSFQVKDNGSLFYSGTTNVARPDLASVLGTANGYSVSLLGLTPGAHTIQLYALDASSGAATLIGTRTVYGNRAPIGAIDLAGPTTLSGWAGDLDTTATAATINVYVDGSTTAFYTGTASLARADLASFLGTANHAYSVDLSALSAGIHRVDLYVNDTTTSTPTLVASRTLTTNRDPFGSLDAFSATQLSGWAFDPNSSASACQIVYQIDTHAAVTVTADANRADLTSWLGSAAHGYTIALPQLTAGSHTARVWAVDTTSNALTLLGTRSLTITAPTGNAFPYAAMDVFSYTTVAGWAYDPTTPATAITMRIDIDGVMGSPFTADTTRSDLAVLGSTNHGYSQTLSLTGGEHRIDVYAYDTTTNTPVLVARRNVSPAGFNNGTPFGAIDTASASTLAGWAYATGTGSTALIRLDIDGLAGVAAATNVVRSDLTSLLGAGTFGYNFTTPTLAAGTHTVRLVYLDPLTLSATTLATQTLITT